MIKAQKKQKLSSAQCVNNFVVGANAATSAASAVQAFSSAIDPINSDARKMFEDAILEAYNSAE